MEITPRELRDIEIREAFRGYSRDEVNDLLERAAGTIEEQADKIRQLSERLGSAQTDAGRTRETEDILHRTLVLAQRAADEAVAEAQARSRQLVEDAEAQARRTLSEAESEARRKGESERRRLEQEIVDLAAKREVLLGDVEALVRYESDFRDRVVQRLEEDLETWRSRPSVSSGARPDLTDVELPVARESVTRREPVEHATQPVDVHALFAQKIAAADLTDEPEPEPEPAAIEIGDSSDEANEPATTAGVTAPAGESLFTTAGADAETDAEAEVLDDDDFFASLRQAVSDEAPLGPRDDDRTPFFDQDESERGLFRRRR